MYPGLTWEPLEGCRDGSGVSKEDSVCKGCRSSFFRVDRGWSPEKTPIHPFFYDLVPKGRLSVLENRLHQFSTHFPLPSILGPSIDPSLGRCYLFLPTWGRLRVRGARSLPQKSWHLRVRKRILREKDLVLLLFCVYREPKPGSPRASQRWYGQPSARNQLIPQAF